LKSETIFDIILPEDHFPENNGKWNEWYFEFEDKKHYSMFENYDAWYEYYNPK
jgi:hypothetical protein